MTIILDKKTFIKADDKRLSNYKIKEKPKRKGDKIVTLNKQGFMRLELSFLDKLWIYECQKSDNLFLELGSAYGNVTSNALNLGGRVIANDIDLDHLLILKENINPQLQNNLYINNQSFPDKLELPSNSIGSVLFCRLGHFFTNEVLLNAFNKIYNWLIPGGYVFFSGVSPYHYSLERFLPLYVKNKKDKISTAGYKGTKKKRA